MLRSLHSNLVLFKFCRCLDVVKESVLYIPIWFYSNLFLIKSATTSIIFTFQSGSIQIIPFFTIKSNILTLHSNLVLFKCMMPFCFDIKESLYIPIWFYSNLIQVQILAMAISALHSNLVLFKLRHRTEKSTQLTSFTFQSGSIQMIMRENRLQLLLLFTFQSGSIQILTTYNIPTDQLNFTFQSGSIQIV